MQFHELIHSDPEAVRGQIVSIVGGGGKSSLLIKIGKELAELGLKVILTSTTKVEAIPRIALTLVEESPDFPAELQRLLAELGIVLVADSYYQELRLKGVSRGFVPSLLKYADVVLVEADGCRQRALKTHAEHEPPIPPQSNTVIIVCGADVVGHPLNQKYVHRSELFAAKWNLKDGTILTPEIIAKELLSPYSYLKNIPLQAEVRLFINKQDTNKVGAKLLAEHLVTCSSYPVFRGSLKQGRLKRVSFATTSLA